MNLELPRIALAALLLASASAGAVTPLLLPHPAGAAKLTSADTPVQFNRAALARLVPGNPVELVLPDGSRHEYLYESSIHHGGSVATWIARSPLTGANERAIITFGPHGTFGTMNTRHGAYRVYPSGQGHDLLAKEPPRDVTPRFPGGDAVVPTNDGSHTAFVKGIPTWLPGAFETGPFLKAEPFPQVRVDVMVIYTRDLATKLGDATLPMIYNMIDAMNVSLADSEVAIRMRLVNATLMDYANGDYPSVFGTPGTLAAMEGLLDNAPLFSALSWGSGSVRDTFGADLVTIVRDGPTDTGGMAYILSTHPASGAAQTKAYSVLNYCRAGCAGLFSHEAGHNFGIHHDPATLASQNNGALLPGAYAYSLGYYSCSAGLNCNPYVAGGCAGDSPRCAGTNANDFGDVMSYLTPKLARYSNAAQADCVPPGGSAAAPRACGGAVPAPAPGGTTSNTALSMNNTRVSISGYRTQTIVNHPGSLQFTKTTYAGVEGGNLVFTVSRYTGNAGAVSVSYAIMADTATAGADFMLASGTLQWASGDSADKTITVPLVADGIAEYNETIRATLSAPSGPVGVYLGYPTVATGLIASPWPHYGGVPPGFSSASTPSFPWAVSTDRFDPSGGDTASFASAAIGEYGTGVSSTVYTGTFVAGLVAFSYNVSSYIPNAFEFLVDGVVVFSDGGNSGAWKSFSMPLAAGTHTLEWRYTKTYAYPCSTFNGVYTGCVDRAWIDTVAIPITGTPPAPPPPANPPRLANISTRGQVMTGGDVMIAGFIIGGLAPKTVVATVAGPSMAGVLPGALANPTLTLVRSSDGVVIGTNDNWQTQTTPAHVSQIQTAGFAPAHALEPALIATLAPGAYTAIVQGVGSTGIGLVGLYEVDQPNVPLINISTRGQVMTGNDVMIAGFIIQGSGPQAVVVTVAGPSLVPAGIPNALMNPALTIVRSSDGVVIATNDNWQVQAVPGDVALIQNAGFAPAHPNEPAAILTLPPGAYTAIVQGVGGTSGVGLVGVYRVP